MRDKSASKRGRTSNHSDVHTLLRLPSGIWYSAGVKANVLFFDRTPASEKELWIYDLRTNKNYTQRHNPIGTDDLKDFIESYNPVNRRLRKESPRFKRFSYSEILARDKASLDIFWMNDTSLPATENLPPPEVLAGEIVSYLEEALREFGAVEKELKK